MVPVSLVVPESVPRDFLDRAVAAGLLICLASRPHFSTEEQQPPHALFERIVSGSCACGTRDMLAVRDRTVFASRERHSALGFPSYALPDDCTFEETYVIVTWLLRHKMKTFRTHVKKNKKNNKEEGLQRVVDYGGVFRSTLHSRGCCECFVLERDPIFMLEKIVLSPFGKGPVLEKCVLSPSSSRDDDKFSSEMNLPEHTHALLYATEATKFFQMEEYKKKYPHYFDDAVLVKRPATHTDYFVPPSLANQCFVVESIRMGEMGCKRLSCLQFKRNWEMCEENDPVQWIRIGKRYELACQPSCKDHSVHTEWTEDDKPNPRCVLANPLKKNFASMPEKLFERASRHVFHGGLDVVRGGLKLNERYCTAYGLDFVDDDCVASGGQQFGEFLFGKTAIRAAKSGGMKPLPYQPPVNLPDYMNYNAGSGKGRRTKRSLGSKEENDDDDTHDNRAYFYSLALDLSKEFGQELSAFAVKRFLKRRAPKLASQVIDKLAIRLVLKHSVVTAMKGTVAGSLKMLGKSVGVVTTVFAVYDMISTVLDDFDPFDYMKVVDKEKLEKIDKQLDHTYYEDGPVRPELTLEYVWENDILNDREINDKRLDFMVSKVEEYLVALQNIPKNVFHERAEERKRFVWIETKETDWKGKLWQCILFMTLCLTFLFNRWIHVWTCVLFFVLLFYNAI